jgi:hypothetical protein
MGALVMSGVAALLMPFRKGGKDWFDGASRRIMSLRGTFRLVQLSHNVNVDEAPCHTWASTVLIFAQPFSDLETFLRLVDQRPDNFADATERRLTAQSERLVQCFPGHTSQRKGRSGARAGYSRRTNGDGSGSPA